MLLCFLTLHSTTRALTSLSARLPACPTPQVAVGHNHTIAVCSDGGVWTWGFGGYGRLGHKVQQVGSKASLLAAAV